MTKREQLLEDARRIVAGERETTYGGPEQSFANIADYWSIYLGRTVYPHDVAIMMALLKIARLQQSQCLHHDSLVDLAGYAACAAECAGI